MIAARVILLTVFAASFFTNGSDLTSSVGASLVLAAFAFVCFIGVLFGFVFLTVKAFPNTFGRPW